MWYHLRARFDKTKLRVLYPGICACLCPFSGLVCDMSFLKKKSPRNGEFVTLLTRQAGEEKRSIGVGPLALRIVPLGNPFLSHFLGGSDVSCVRSKIWHTFWKATWDQISYVWSGGKWWKKKEFSSSNLKVWVRGMEVRPLLRTAALGLKPLCRRVPGLRLNQDITVLVHVSNCSYAK